MMAKQTELVFVNGTAMKGGSLARNLAHSEFLGEAATARSYRFFSIRDEFPGLITDREGRASIAGEIYRVDLETISQKFLPDEPEELELSLIELSDGRYALGMVLRTDVQHHHGVTEITKYGGWRNYVASRGSQH